MNLYQELEYRGLIDNITSPDLIDKLNNGGLTFYIGTDPTADSLHIGHFCALLTAKRLKDKGHNPILLVGGATGLIGDPKPNSERPIISKEQININIEGIKKQLNTIFGFKLVNNADWLNNLNLIDYLRDYGKLFNVNYMINKDTVKRRLDIGITYTEFSYMILQSIDYLKLYESENCCLQIGGQDQWGNITSGLELIRKAHEGANVYGLTMPLITKADGSKFGKSEQGTVWLDKKRTSPYELYQFFINTEDEKAVEYLKKFTFLDKDQIEVYEKEIKENPHLRLAQKALAKEVVQFLHGKEGLDSALRITEALFSGKIIGLKEEEIEQALKEFPKINVDESKDILTVLNENKIATSKREAKQLIEENAIIINDEKVTDINYLFMKKNSLYNKYFVLRRGKKKYYLLSIN